MPTHGAYIISALSRGGVAFKRSRSRAGAILATV